MSFPMASDTKTEGETADSGAKAPAPNSKTVAAGARLRRQAQALRDNLKRRKDQSRSRKSGGETSEDREDP
ncbi:MULTISPECIES: hypothetical protein [unclassified Beijerinckia]|uniref:hypothetical protein n=1 Tax=unclassified Beijerinckia TaxID=2638183 RepID=UPI001114AAB4|nr:MULTISPECIES: hypothetical protein [unclassified Beijerinckia]MDH7797777.1 hypothetical protein [Beijerinckia sp. GAS462]